MATIKQIGQQANHLSAVFLGGCVACGLLRRKLRVTRPALEPERQFTARVGHLLLPYALWLGEAISSKPVFSEKPPFRIPQKQTTAGRGCTRRVMGGPRRERNLTRVFRVHLR